MKGRWTCAQHGDSCRSYVQSEIGFDNPHSFNARGITPDKVKDLPSDEQTFIIKCLKWINS